MIISINHTQLLSLCLLKRNLKSIKIATLLWVNIKEMSGSKKTENEICTNMIFFVTE